jgi:hypothetical protein
VLVVGFCFILNFRNFKKKLGVPIFIFLFFEIVQIIEYLVQVQGSFYFKKKFVFKYNLLKN